MVLKLIQVIIIFISLILFSCDDTVTPKNNDLGTDLTIEKPSEKKVIRYNVLSRINNREELSELYGYLQNSALQEKLEYEKGPFTLFAPDNYALANTFNIEDSINVANMANAQMVNGKITTVSLTKKIRTNGGTYTMKTLSGESLIAYKKGRDIYVKNIKGEEAKIGKSDITATNGIIHIIDNVLAY